MTATVTAGSYAVLYVSGASTATSGTEAMDTLTNYTKYQIHATAKRVIDPTYASTTWSGTGTRVNFDPPGTGKWCLNRLNGELIAGTDQGAGSQTISTKYLPMSAILYAKDFSLNIKPKVVETSALCSAGLPYQSMKPTIRDLSGTIGTFFDPVAATFSPTISEYFLTHLSSDAVFALKFYMSVNYELLAWVRVDTDAIKAAVGGLIEETVTFRGVPDAEGRVISQA